MKTLDGVVYASVFGGDFPVCSEKQALELEEAYAKALKYEEEHPEEKNDLDRCTCDMIIGLLNGTLNRYELMAAAIFIAKDIYQKKLAADFYGKLMEQAQRAMVSFVSPDQKETVH